MTSRSYKSGDTLMKLMLPFAHCLLIQNKSHLCDFCFKRNKSLRKCSACKYMHYCSQECQRQDWTVHKIECANFMRSFKSISLLDDDLTRLLLRVLIKAKIGECKKSDEIGMKTLSTLIDHYQEVMNDQRRISKCLKCLDEIKSVMGVEFMEFFTIKECISYFGKLVINTFSISNDDLSETLGSGLYLSLSSLNHSCNPNCAIIFNGLEASVKAIREFSDEPFISYTEFFSPRKQRQKFLQESYYFNCQCSRCSETKGIDHQMLQLKCHSCISYLPDLNGFDDENETFECGNCSKPNRIQASYINHMQILLTEASDLARTSEQLTTPRYRSLITSMRALINKACFEETLITNIFLIRTCETLLDAYIRNGQFNEAIRIALDHLAYSYNLYLPQQHPSKALLFIKIVKLALHLNDLKTARLFFTKAEEGLVKLHDSDHPLRSTVLKELYYQL